MSFRTLDSPPQHFQSSDGSIQGAINGTNALFTTGVRFRRIWVYRNGKLQTLNADYVAGGQSFEFINQVPQTGDTISALVWV
jgi:hypothetical protein